MKKVGIVLSKESQNASVQLDRLETLDLGEWTFEVIGTPFQEKSKIKKSKILFPLEILFYTIACLRRLLNNDVEILMNICRTYSDIPLLVILGNLFEIKTIARLTGGIERSKNIFQEFWEYIVKKFFLKKSDRIIVLGPKKRSNLIKEGIPQNKIWVIPTTPPFTELKSDSDYKKERFRKKLGIPLSKEVVLFVGRVTKEKGADVIGKAATDLDDKNYLFCIIGEGDYEEKLKKCSNVDVRGREPHSRVFDYYRSADLVLLPSKSEGLPNVVLEALSCGVPVLARRVGEIPWLVSNTFSTYEELRSYLVSENWELDPLPKIFKRKNIRARYLELLDNLSR